MVSTILHVDRIADWLMNEFLPAFVARVWECLSGRWEYMNITTKKEKGALLPPFMCACGVSSI